MKPSFDPAELFPMPNTRGAAFEGRSKETKESKSARLLGQTRNLPSAKSSGGLSLLAVRSTKR